MKKLKQESLKLKKTITKVAAPKKEKVDEKVKKTKKTATKKTPAKKTAAKKAPAKKAAAKK